MDWQAACAAVIPCLNEEAAVGSLVREVRRYLRTVVVVNDGSIDRTAQAAGDAGAVVLNHAQPLGKGFALKTGWTFAREGGFSWALTLDGDGQHWPEDIPLFLRCAEAGGPSLIVGNRMGDAARMPPLRRWVNRWMSRQLSELAGRALPDSQCGFRMMNLKDWARLPIRAGHFEIESEVLLAFAAAGLAIEFVPVRVIYKAEQSKIHPVRDTARWLRWRRGASRHFRDSPIGNAGNPH